MQDTMSGAVLRLRAAVDDATEATVAIPVADLRLLLERQEALEREQQELRRKAAKGAEMLDAATIFLKAYGEKYRNFASGGIRPTAILQSEVKVMWAVFNEFRGLTESEPQQPDAVQELKPRRSVGLR